MNVSRRFFIGGFLGAAALGPRGLFAVPAGTASGGRPNLTFGVLSDVHIALAKGGLKLSARRNTTYLEKALRFFRDGGADAVVIAGDITNNGVIGELKAVADAWYRVFPNDRAPDGRRVERIFVFGNHDWSGANRGRRVYGDAERARAEALATDPKRFWDACFHEEWREFFTREVNGYRFVGAHWCKGSGKFGDCNGRCETFIAGLADRYAALKGKIDPSLPFFHVQHPHPRGTVHGPDVWGQDDGESTKILSAWPNAVSLSGHSHTSLLDERSVWQGAFTAVGTSTLQNAGASGLSCGLAAGYENGHAPERNGLDAFKVMPEIDRFEAKQGQLVRVYPDRIAFSRRDFVNDTALEDDLVMPLPSADPKPFAFAARAAASRAPAFAPGAALALRFAEAKPRGAKKGTPPKPCVEITIPPANGDPRARCVRYEVVAKGADGQDLRIALLSDGFRFAASDRRVNAPLKCRIARDRLAVGDLTFTVTAHSTWGKASAPLRARLTNPATGGCARECDGRS